MTKAQGKIKALIAAADLLEKNPEKYRWAYPAQCNCGVLAQAALGIDPPQLRARMNGYLHLKYWSSLSEKFNPTFCKITHLPVAQVLGKLYDIGFTPNDIRDLEQLTNFAVWKEMNMMPMRASHCFTAELVAQYMRAWAKLLGKKTRKLEAV